MHHIRFRDPLAFKALRGLFLKEGREGMGEEKMGRGGEKGKKGEERRGKGAPGLGAR